MTFIHHPTWISDCGDVPIIMNSLVTLDNPGTATYGSTATVSCTPGYETENTTIYCLETGKWENNSCSLTGEFIKY